MRCWTCLKEPLSAQQRRSQRITNPQGECCFTGLFYWYQDPLFICFKLQEESETGSQNVCFESAYKEKKLEIILDISFCSEVYATYYTFITNGKINLFRNNLENISRTLYRQYLFLYSNGCALSI